MTIDELGRMIVEGFAEQEEKLRTVLREEVNPRLGAVEGRLDAVEYRLGTVEQKVDALRSDMGGAVHDAGKLKNRMENLEIHSFGSIQAA